MSSSPRVSQLGAAAPGSSQRLPGHPDAGQAGRVGVAPGARVLEVRPDLARIANWIEPGSRVLDLGCADGALLDELHRTRQVRGKGVEINDQCVIACVRRGVDVIQQNLEEGLALFDDQAFDTVVLSKTLQAMHRTEHILHEMVRVARYGVVSFPNFGYWPHGWSILRGRMPVTGEMPYQWYDTPNVHLCTLKDFEDLARKSGLRILERATFDHGKEVHLLPSWRSTLAVYRFTAAGS